MHYSSQHIPVFLAAQQIIRVLCQKQFPQARQTDPALSMLLRLRIIHVVLGCRLVFIVTA